MKKQNKQQQQNLQRGDEAFLVARAVVKGAVTARVAVMPRGALAGGAATAVHGPGGERSGNDPRGWRMCGECSDGA